MKLGSFFTQLLSALSRTHWQILLAVTAFVVAFMTRFPLGELGLTIVDTRQTASVLGSIGAVLALASSLAFGFVVFFVNHANSRKHDLFFRFKTGLFELDKFLKECPQSLELVQSTSALSWELKFLKMRDFPIMDWEDKLSSVANALGEKDDREPTDPNLDNKILGYLGYLEDVVSEIGVMCVRQVIAGVHISTVSKAFGVLAALLICLVINNYATVVWVVEVLAALPAFFAVMAALILVEISWYLYREGEELLDFLTKEKGEDSATQ